MKQENADPDSRVLAQRKKANLKACSSLYKLDPFLDSKNQVPENAWSGTEAKDVRVNSTDHLLRRGLFWYLRH